MLDNLFGLVAAVADNGAFIDPAGDCIACGEYTLVGHRDSCSVARSFRYANRDAS